MRVIQGDDGRLLSYTSGEELPFEEIAKLAGRPGIDAAGVMHTPSNLVSDAVSKICEYFDGPMYAYPDSGYFEMPNWKFEDVVSPEELAGYAAR